MTDKELPPDLAARWEEPKSSGTDAVFVIVISVFALALLIVLNKRSNPLSAVVMVVMFVTISAILATYISRKRIRIIELRRSGTIDFVSKSKKDSFQCSEIARVTGKTARGKRGAVYYSAYFLIQTTGGEKTEKRIELTLDNELQSLVRKLEQLNPRVDTAQYWQWEQTLAESRQAHAGGN